MQYMSRLAWLLAATLLISGCVTTQPQRPLELLPGALVNPDKRVGVAVAKLPKPTLHLPGANCLLCMVAAQAANSGLSRHAESLTLDEVATVKEQLAAALRKKGGSQVVVITEEVDVQSLADHAGGANAARKNFAQLRQKLGVDKLLLVEVEAAGFERAYSAYIPTSDPKSVLRATGYIVDLSSNQYDWYQRVMVVRSAEGPWNEPVGGYPGLTNAYYRALEAGKDRLLTHFTAVPLNR